MDGARNLVKAEAMLHGQHVFGEQLSGLLGNHGNTYDKSRFLRDHSFRLIIPYFMEQSLAGTDTYISFVKYFIKIRAREYD